MKKVQRDQLLDWQIYVEQRQAIREAVLAVKAPRRIQVGEYLTFLFENATTMRYQIQEMMRVEQIEGEAEILHELKTYNEVLGDDDELGCTLLIEIDDPALRDVLLQRWRDLPAHLHLRLEDGRLAVATFDERQVGEDRLSAVQYLKFDCGGSLPVGIGCDHPHLQLGTELTVEQSRALRDDLRSSPVT